MLGHVPFAISDIYTSPDPAILGLALRTTQEIIDEIEALAPAQPQRHREVRCTMVEAMEQNRRVFSSF